MAKSVSSDGGVPVDDAEGRGGGEHRVLPAHVVGRHWHVDRAAHLGQDVEVVQGGFHHHDVGALGEVQAHLGERFAAVRRVLLVVAAVAATGDLDADGLAERPVEGGGVLGGVGEDRRPDVPRPVEGGPDRADLAVHHPRGRDEVGAGLGLGDGHLAVAQDRGVVVDPAVRIEDATVAVIRVLVKTAVGDEHELVADGVPQGAQGDLDDAVAGRTPP